MEKTLTDNEESYMEGLENTPFVKTQREQSKGPKKKT